MKMYYVANARIPTKKAYGIQMAKMCEAFIEAGVDLTLVVPRTHAARAASMRDFYHLRVDVPTVMIPTLDWYDKGRVGYLISSLVFGKLLFLFFVYRRLRGERGVYYSIPDTFSFCAAFLAGVPRYVEIHDVAFPVGLAFFVKSARTVIATNGEIKSAFQKRFGTPDMQLLVEPNGVDLAAYATLSSKQEARAALHLPQEKKIALYVGRFYAWKGLDILVDAAQSLVGVELYVVGGTEREFRTVTGRAELPSALHIAGECKSDEVPRWLAAADALLILGTSKNETSFRHTSPMKVYEYMAANRPVVASRTPALTSILPEGEAIFYTPDDAQSLAQAIARAISVEANISMVEAAGKSAKNHSWAKRAVRILEYIQ